MDDMHYDVIQIYQYIDGQWVLLTEWEVQEGKSVREEVKRIWIDFEAGNPGVFYDEDANVTVTSLSLGPVKIITERRIVRDD